MARRRKASRVLDSIADRFSSFQKARDVLRVVRAVPTRFPSFDHAVGVGGFPIERFSLVHGPSGGGKTLWTLGLADSFLSRGHFVLHIDAERTTPIDWVESLMGANADHARFFAYRPDSYEDTMDMVRDFLNKVATGRTKGDLAPDTSALVVVDSLRKLVPKALMKTILEQVREEAEAEEEAKKGGKKPNTTGQDRGAQHKARMNAGWMDELVPLLEHAQAGMIAIAREMTDPNADANAVKYKTNWMVGGGSAIYYDASLVVRVERDEWVSQGEGAARRTYGEKHRLTIRKTKVAGKEDRTSVGFFYSSNGTLVPAGFDRARDVLTLGKEFGVVRLTDSSYSFGKKRLGNGQHNAVKSLTAKPELLAELEEAVRSKFADHKPEELIQVPRTVETPHDADGVVIDHPFDRAKK